MSMHKQEQARVVRSLREGHLLSGCTEGDVRKLMKRGLLNHYAAGEHIFWKAEAAQAMYAVVWGKVEILLPKNGDEVPIATLGPGEVFGEMGLVGGAGRSASARAAEDVELFVINEGEMQWIEQHHPQLGVKILSNIVRVMADRLRRDLEEKEAQIAQRR